MRITISIRVDEDLWQEAKIHCVKKNIKLSDFVEDLIEKELRDGKVEVKR